MSRASLPIAFKLAVAPWFSEEAIREGFSLLADGEPQLLFHRQAAGIWFGGEKPVAASIGFEPAPQIIQGFRIIEGRCSACRPIRGKSPQCRHLAALVVAMLGSRCREEKPWPLPLGFAESPWELLGSFLFEQYQRQGTFELAAEKDGWRLRFRCRDRQVLDCLLPAAAAVQFQSFFGRQFPIPDHCSAPGAEALPELFRTLQQQTLTQTEIELRQADRASRSMERDSSPWLWLARSLAMTLDPAALRVKRGPGEGFSLGASHPSAPAPRLGLIPEREHTPGLLRLLAPFLPEVRFLPPARPFFRAELAADSSLLITPCLRLEDGRVFSRPALAGQRFRDHYHLPGEGFLPVAPLARDLELRPFSSRVPGLFEQVRSQGDPDQSFTILNQDLPEFMERNRQGLAHPDNQVDAELLAGPCRQAPDSLEVLAAEEDDHWYYLSGHYRIGSRRVSLVELLAARQQGLSFLPGSGLRLDGTGLDWFYRLGPERFWRQDGAIKGVRLSRPELLRLTGVIGKAQLPESAGSERLRNLLRPESWLEAAALPETPEHLREYQRTGLAWLYHLHAYGLGGILADDMGLGKTHQALGLVWVLSRQSGGDRLRFLVVCPATVASHWIHKLERFYPGISWRLHHGPARSLDRTREAQVVITTYGTLRQDAAALAGTGFEVILFDEMQQLKNKQTAVYQAASGLGGRVRIGLTGTPLENSVRDLKALFDLCLPGVLGPDKSFVRHYVVPITEQASREKREELARLLKPFLLRRDRRQVLRELPEIIEDIRTCELSEDQVALYREAVGGQGGELLARLAAGGGQVPQMELLALITTLKQICNHPALLASGSEKAAACASGKWDLLLELLTECLDGGMKVVIFSQFTRMLELIEQYLAAQAIGFAGLRGSMTLKARRRAIERFNTEPDCRVFCASLLAGGTGIDLTAAQAVIHYDRWWNAAREDQATARVHRMGQERVVQVFKLLTVGTLEEKIHRLIESRRDLAGQLIQADDAGVIRRLSREELLELLRWQR